jgi:hypothetical protein
VVDFTPVIAAHHQPEHRSWPLATLPGTAYSTHASRFPPLACCQPAHDAPTIVTVASATR